MKITKVTPLMGQGNICASWVFAKVETDEGIVGYGEGTRHAGPVIAEAIRWLEPHVVGTSPFDIESLYATLFKATHYVWGSVFSCAITAIETALWDIMGKATGKPVYDLIGGKVWDDVRLYSHIGGGSQIIRMDLGEGSAAADDFGAIKERAQDLVSRGFTCVKTFQANRYQITKGSAARLGDFWPNMHMDRDDIQATARKVEFIRQQVGEGVEITFDAHGLNAVSALRLAKALEPLDLLWYEEPVHPFNLSALKQLRAETSIPIAMSERLHASTEFAEVIDTDAVDVVMVDVQWCGGVSQAKKIAAIAESRYLPITLHNCNSPLASIINAHIAVTLPNFISMEFMDPDVPWRDEIITEPLRVKEGRLELNDKPGWGVDINEEMLARYPYERGSSAYEERGQRIRPATGSRVSRTQ
jgi:galactonate dehydratase